MRVTEAARRSALALTAFAVLQNREGARERGTVWWQRARGALPADSRESLQAAAACRVCGTRCMAPRCSGVHGIRPAAPCGSRSQKVVGGGLLGRNAASLLRCRLEDLVVLRQVLIQLEDRGHVAAAVAVVGRRPHRDERLVGEHVLVALHHKLVGARDEVDGVGRVELRHHIATEQVPRATGGEPPAINVLRVGPHEIAHRSIVRHLLLAVDDADLVERVDGGGEAAVHAEDLVLDDRRE
mmetsp:Transcript_20571/g.52340  ORF Transcript_20571/g.52340 Transcript_20571/m.52340 type:complete len:241 (-) Transcript_20571:499-1221(-)